MQPLEATRVANTAVPPAATQTPPPPPVPPPPVPGLTPPPPPVAPRPERHRSRLGRLAGSVALIAVGVLGAADLAGARVPASAYLVLPLTVIGAGLVVGGWYGRARSLIVFGAILSVALAITSAAERGIGGASGTVTWQPTAFEQLDRTYTIGTGNARLDLSGVDFTDRSTAVEVSVGVGNLTVILPSNVDVTVEANVDIGNARVLGGQWNGINQGRRTVTDNGADGPGGGQLSLRASVDVGDLEVRR